MGPKEPRSTVLTPEQEAACVVFRKHTLLPLDDCLYALQSSVPCLTRSSLHHLFQRHNISRLPEVEGEKLARKKFAQYPIGYFHIDIAEVRTEEGKLYLFVAIDRTSKFVYAELLPKYGKMEAAQFLRNLIAVVPYKIHTIVTDNGIQFAHRKTDRYAFLHIFDRVCLENGTEHRLTPPNHPWTNGQTISLRQSSAIVAELNEVLNINELARIILKQEQILNRLCHVINLVINLHDQQERHDRVWLAVIPGIGIKIFEGIKLSGVYFLLCYCLASQTRQYTFISNAIVLSLGIQYFTLQRNSAAH